MHAQQCAFSAKLSLQGELKIARFEDRILGSDLTNHPRVIGSIALILRRTLQLPSVSQMISNSPVEIGNSSRTDRLVHIVDQLSIRSVSTAENISSLNHEYSVNYSSQTILHFRINDMEPHYQATLSALGTNGGRAASC